jgi:hypothetical protein
VEEGWSRDNRKEGKKKKNLGFVHPSIPLSSLPQQDLTI